MSNYNNFQKKLIRLVEQKFNHGKKSTWKNKDFENLSFEICKDTKVLISTATLKRLFGKVKTNNDYKPQDNTLKALASYAKYDVKKDRYTKLYLIIILIIAIVSSVSLTYLFFKDYDIFIPSQQNDQGTLKLIRTEGNKCPTTAFFNYSLPKTDKPIFIDFGDLSPKYQLNGNGTHAHFYAYPGYFKAMLKSNKKTISDTANIFVQTNGWQALAHYPNTINNERYYPIPIYDNITNETFCVSKNNMKALGIDPKEIVIVSLNNYRNTNTNGDNFTYTSRFKGASFWPAVRCYATTLSIIGEKGKIQLKFIDKGCSRYCQTILSEKNMNSINNDLNGFVVDHNKWMNLLISNKNKSVNVFINHKLVFSDIYKRSIGNIIGTSIDFYGSGSVQQIEMKTLDEQCIFSTNF